MCPPDPKFARNMSSIITDSPKHGEVGLDTIFRMPTTQRELTTTPFYRWFILNAIHKRNFKNGQLAAKIPWIPSGVEAWKLESVLSIMAASPLLPDDEKETVNFFLREYQSCLSRGDGIMTDEFCLAWDTLKRMFDLNDPAHIAFQSVKRRSQEADGDNQMAGLHESKKDIEGERGRKEAAETVKLKMGSDDELQDVLVLEGKEPETPRGKKRVVSRTAERSTSPTKKNRPIQIKVSEVSSDSSSSSESSDSYLCRFKEMDLDIDTLEELQDAVPFH